jgi:hypothetical protein
MVDSKFSIGDLVFYEGQLYFIKTIHFLNPQIPSDPFVCGLVLKGDKTAYPRQLMVREGLLAKDNPEAAIKAIKVLYGKDKGHGNP